jgi:hypothetical protein
MLICVKMFQHPATAPARKFANKNSTVRWNLKLKDSLPHQAAFFFDIGFNRVLLHFHEIKNVIL